MVHGDVGRAPKTQRAPMPKAEPETRAGSFHVCDVRPRNLLPSLNKPRQCLYYSDPWLRFGITERTLASYMPGGRLGGCAGGFSSSRGGSGGNGGSMGLRGNIWSRCAAMYTKEATITAICFRSSGCRRS